LALNLENPAEPHQRTTKKILPRVRNRTNRFNHHEYQWE